MAPVVTEVSKASTDQQILTVRERCLQWWSWWPNCNNDMQQQLQLTRNKLEINKYLTQYFLLEQNQPGRFFTHKNISSRYPHLLKPLWNKSFLRHGSYWLKGMSHTCSRRHLMDSLRYEEVQSLDNWKARSYPKPNRIYLTASTVGLFY